MSAWQMIVEFLLQISQSAFACRLIECLVQEIIELTDGKAASTPDLVLRWHRYAFRLAGLRSDQVQALSMIAEAAWALGGTTCIRSVVFPGPRV